MKRLILNLTLLVCTAFCIQALTPYHPPMKGEKQMFPQTTVVRAAAEQTSNVTVDPAPGEVLSLKSFNITFTDATEVTKGDVNYGNAPYVCEKGSSTKKYCFTINAEGNVLTVATTSELTALGKYELHLPGSFYNVDGKPAANELIFDYTIVETLSDKEDDKEITVTVDPAPGKVLSLKSFDVTFAGATEVTKGEVSYGNAPYVCEKGSSTKKYCFTINAAGNVLTVAMTSELTALGDYELHLPGSFYNVDGKPAANELIYDYTIVETLSDKEDDKEITVTVDPAPGKVLSLKSFDVTFAGATEVTKGEVSYGNAPYVCEKGSTTKKFCFTITAAGNVLTVAMTSELTALGDYELHLPGSFYNIDGKPAANELIYDYTIVETLSDDDDENSKIIVSPAPGDVLSLKSFDITFTEATAVTKGDVGYGNAPYVCEKGSTTKKYCFTITAAGNVLTVAMTSELTALGEYELHLPGSFYNIDGKPAAEELIFNYTIVETLSDGILRDAPAGDRVDCMTRFAGYFPDYGGDRLWCWPIYGKPTHYIKGEDGNLYLYNPIVTAPFSNKPIESYLKVEQIDGKYIAKFPQAIFKENFEGKDEIMYLNLAKKTENTFKTVEAENNQVEFVFDGDTPTAILPVGGDFNDYLLAAFTADGVWSYYGNYEMDYVPFTYTTVAPPADGIVSDYVMSYTMGEQKAETNVSVILQDDEIWIKGLSQKQLPNAWAHGEIDGNKVYFDEYLGYAESVGQYAFLYQTGQGDADNELEPLVFNYDASLNTLSLIGYELTVNPNTSFYYALEHYANPVVKPIEETPLTTKVPKPIGGFDAFFHQGGGKYSVQIRVSTENTADEVLPASKLFYEILCDDESVYVFSPENYPALTESFSLIPLDYQLAGVIRKNQSVRTFSAYLSEGEENLGARMVYRDETGTYYSETVWAKPHTDSVDGTFSDAECVSTQYFDISGREIKAPAEGIYIKKETYTDGKVKITKGNK